MIDNDIIKALECCRKKECNTCPCYDDEIECGEMLIGHTLDLINRQKAEIERYKGVIKLLEKDVRKAKTEAIKELAKGLKEKSRVSINQCGETKPIIYFDDIDDLVKEMTEQKNRNSKAMKERF